MSNTYVILMETSADECESWMNFIRVNGNEEALNHLNTQLEKLDGQVIDDEMNTFDLDMKHPVSESTAQEMCRTHLNHSAYHRKFDGVLKRVDFKLQDSDKIEKMQSRVNKLLKNGRIDRYIDREEEFEHTESEYETDDESESDDSVESDHSRREHRDRETLKKGLPKGGVVDKDMTPMERKAESKKKRR